MLSDCGIRRAFTSLIQNELFKDKALCNNAIMSFSSRLTIPISTIIDNIMIPLDENFDNSRILFLAMEGSQNIMRMYLAKEFPG